MLYPTELTMIFDGEDGWLHDGVRYRLACAPGLTVCPNGDLLCTWLSGSGGEPAVDNCSLISRSVDGGENMERAGNFRSRGSCAGLRQRVYI